MKKLSWNSLALGIVLRMPTTGLDGKQTTDVKNLVLLKLHVRTWYCTRMTSESLEGRSAQKKHML